MVNGCSVQQNKQKKYLPGERIFFFLSPQSIVLQQIKHIEARQLKKSSYLLAAAESNEKLPMVEGVRICVGKIKMKPKYHPPTCFVISLVIQRTCQTQYSKYVIIKHNFGIYPGPTASQVEQLKWATCCSKYYLLNFLFFIFCSFLFTCYLIKCNYII